MPSSSPSARTDCMPQETHDTPSTTARRTAPMPPACPPRSNRQSQPENARTSEEGEEEHEGRKGEKMRTCARLPAVLPSKSYIDRTPPQNGQASRHPSPHRLKLPVSRRTPARFYLCQFCFWRVCRTPAYFRPSADEQRHPAACLDATGTGGAFTFSRPPRFSRNGLVPLLYHVHPISPFFTREQSRRFPNSK